MLLGHGIGFRGRSLGSLRHLRLLYKKRGRFKQFENTGLSWRENQSRHRLGMRYYKHELTASVIGGTDVRNFTKKESVNIEIGLALEGVKKKNIASECLKESLYSLYSSQRQVNRRVNWLLRYFKVIALIMLVGQQS